MAGSAARTAAVLTLTAPVALWLALMTGAPEGEKGGNPNESNEPAATASAEQQGGEPAEEEYILDQRILSENEIYAMEKFEIRYTINSIYAYHGYSFADESWTQEFEKISWYNPVEGKTQDECAVEFNETERANLEALVSRELEEGWR